MRINWGSQGLTGWRKTSSHEENIAKRRAPIIFLIGPAKETDCAGSLISQTTFLHDAVSTKITSYMTDLVNRFSPGFR